MSTRTEKKLALRQYGSGALPPAQAPKFEKYVPPPAAPVRAGSMDYKNVPSMAFGKRT